MLKATLIAAALFAAATVPTYAASMMPMSKCDDSSMMKGKVDGMTNMAHKKMAMKDMGTAM